MTLPSGVQSYLGYFKRKTLLNYEKREARKFFVGYY